MPAITVDAALNARLRHLMIERVDDGLDLTGQEIVYEDDTPIEPLTRHPFVGRRMFLNPLGYGGYCWSNLRQSRIGRYSSIAENVRFMGPDHPTDWAATHPMIFGPTYRDKMRANGFPDWAGTAPFRVKKPAAEIGHDVWIGRDVVLGRQIKIGNGAIIAGGAIVTKDVPPYAIVGGVPAKLIRYRLPEEQIARLAATEWWNYRMSDFGQLKFNNVDAFIERFEARKAGLPRLPAPGLTAAELVAGSGPLPDRAGWL